MRLDGGIDTYSFTNERYKLEETPKGRRVTYLNSNGHNIQRKRANRYFTEGQILTVKEIYVGRGSSNVEFIELPHEKFNTVMFEDIES